MRIPEGLPSKNEAVVYKQEEVIKILQMCPIIIVRIEKHMKTLTNYALQCFIDPLGQINLREADYKYIYSSKINRSICFDMHKINV